MSLQEHDNSQYTKEKDEIEKYLLRIVQRYFDIENNYTKESIEAIIVESLARFKQTIIKEKGFLFSLNQKTGHLILTIKDFGGEYTFNKNSAFNKDFGNQSDTICSGDDVRLENPREPLEHYHDLGDVHELVNALNTLNLDGNTHMHNNISTLDILTYSGNKAVIDLTVVDYLQTTVNHYCENLLYHKAEINKLNTKSVNQILSYRTIISNELLVTISILKDTINWLQDVKNYAYKMISHYKLDVGKELLNYMTNDSYNKLMNHFNKNKSSKFQGEFGITDGPITFTTYDDYTIFNEFKETRFNTGISNAKIKLFFRYEDKEGLTITAPLPYTTIHNCGGTIVIQGGYTNDGEIVITSNFFNKAPFAITQDNLYGTEKAIVPFDDLVWYDDKLAELEQQHASFCIINNKKEMEFVNTLLTDGKEYYIHGCNGNPSDPDAPYYDYYNNEIPYLDFDDGQPILSFANYLIINSNRKMATAVITRRYRYVAQYEIKRLTQYIKNPRIMYQVLI